MTCNAENVFITISKAPALYLGPSYLNGNKCQLDMVNHEKEKLDQRKRRRELFWEQEDPYIHYTIDDYDDYLDGVSFQEIHQRQEQQKSQEIEYLLMEDRWWHDNYQRQLMLKHENKISLPQYHLCSFIPYEDPWSLPYDDDDDDHNYQPPVSNEDSEESEYSDMEN